MGNVDIAPKYWESLSKLFKEMARRQTVAANSGDDFDMKMAAFSSHSFRQQILELQGLGYSLQTIATALHTSPVQIAWRIGFDSAALEH